jgi:hypothetical protein
MHAKGGSVAPGGSQNVGSLVPVLGDSGGSWCRPRRLVTSVPGAPQQTDGLFTQMLLEADRTLARNCKCPAQRGWLRENGVRESKFPRRNSQREIGRAESIG